MSSEATGEGPGKAIVSAINQTGLPTTVRGKVQRVILRMVAGVVGPERFEKVRENVSTIEGRSRVDALVAEEVARQAIADPAYMERAKARFLGEIARKQENIEAVASKAQARADAAPDADSESANPHVEPTEDWMNAFIREAENASSDELRDRLAAVLAGEARKPGAYSRSTVRLIAELDREVLVAFQEVLENRVGNAIIREPSGHEGPHFVRAVMLEDAGLISGSSGFTHRKMLFDANGNAFFVGENFGLVANGEATEKQVSIWLLTRAGEEVASLLPQNDERKALRKVAEALDKSGIKKIFIGRKIQIAGDQLLFPEDEVLWQAPDPPAT